MTQHIILPMAKSDVMQLRSEVDLEAFEALASVPSGCPGILLSVCFCVDLPPYILPLILVMK